jgi:peptide chain release factor 1
VQVRAGTGGEEAALWAADLIRLYQKYADTQVCCCMCPAMLAVHAIEGV